MDLSKYPDYRFKESIVDYSKRTGIKDPTIILKKFKQNQDKINAANKVSHPELYNRTGDYQKLDVSKLTPEDKARAAATVKAFRDQLGNEAAYQVASLAKSYVDKASGPISGVVGKIAGPAGTAFDVANKGFNMLYNSLGIPEDVSVGASSNRVVQAVEEARRKYGGSVGVVPPGYTQETWDKLMDYEQKMHEKSLKFFGQGTKAFHLKNYSSELKEPKMSFLLPLLGSVIGPAIQGIAGLFHHGSGVYTSKCCEAPMAGGHVDLSKQGHLIHKVRCGKCGRAHSIHHDKMMTKKIVQHLIGPDGMRHLKHHTDMSMGEGVFDALIRPALGSLAKLALSKGGEKLGDYLHHKISGSGVPSSFESYEQIHEGEGAHHGHHGHHEMHTMGHHAHHAHHAHHGGAVSHAHGSSSHHGHAHHGEGGENAWTEFLEEHKGEFHGPNWQEIASKEFHEEKKTRVYKPKVVHGRSAERKALAKVNPWLIFRREYLEKHPGSSMGTISAAYRTHKGGGWGL